MNARPHGGTDAFANKRLPASTRLALFVTDDEEQLCGLDLALHDLSCQPRVVPTVAEALTLQLESFFAIVLDESVVYQALSTILPQFVRRAPEAAVLVACDGSSRDAIKAVLGTQTVDWITKPIDGDELVGRLSRFERLTRTRNELEDSLHLIRRVVDTTPEMLYLFDVQAGYTVYVNRQVCAVLGCTPEGIPAEGFSFFKSIAHPDDSSRIARDVAEKMSAAKDGEIVHSEFRIQNRHQRWCWIHARETIFHRDEKGGPRQILGMAQDITTRRELEQTHALLAAIVASSDDAIIGKHLDGEIMSWNRAAERIYGYAEAEVVGQNISILLPPGRENEVPALLERIRHGVRVEHYQTERRCKDGKLIRVSITISPIVNRCGDVTGASTIARRL